MPEIPEVKQPDNPVFTYRAAFRATAGRVQWILIWGGLMLFAVYGMLYFIVGASRNLIGIISLIGLAIMLAGIAWGYYWRQMIRNEFIQKFGPKS